MKEVTTAVRRHADEPCFESPNQAGTRKGPCDQHHDNHLRVLMNHVLSPPAKQGLERDPVINNLIITYPGAISPRNPGFSGKWYLETMVWALRVLIAVGLAIVSQVFHWIKLEYIVYGKQTLSLYGYFQSKSDSGQ